jgi:TPR repeat protein
MFCRFATAAVVMLSFAATYAPPSAAQSAAPAKQASVKLDIDDVREMFNAGKFDEVYPKLNRLARNGNVEAKYLLSTMYAEGKGAPGGKADAAKSLKLLRQAATMNYARTPGKWGFAKAQYELAQRYFAGKGVGKSEAQGVKWLTDAAQQGYDKALIELPAHFTGAKGVKKDPQQGYFWAGVGVKNLSGAEQEAARTLLAEYRAMLSDRRVAQLNSKVAEWEPRKD